MRTVILLLVGLLAATLAPSPAGPPAPGKGKAVGPLTPQQAQKEFKVAPGLRVELVACEPQIESPVAMQFDEDGRLWVVEMPDYPNGPGKGEKPHGRIKVLEDKDGDGFYETATVFADGLDFANGLMRWKDGVIVTAAGQILWLRDTQGTGKCDKTEVLYEGFATQNPQLRVSSPVLGMDGRVYCANGLRGGKVRAAGDPKAKVVDLSGRDFRFDPLTGEYEAISGLGQFGNTFDDWGNRFVCDNRHHLRHVVFPQWALERNQYLAITEVHEDVSVLEPGPLSSGGRVYPISNNWTTSNLHAARFTAACGVHVYRGSLLGKEHYGTALTCEPTGNLVHQEVLTPKGPTFTSKPSREGVEFLASPDDWFRPVFLTSGPDGALYVVDMYRAVIEHPEFMPPELKNRPDLTLGKDKGRIWRILPEKHKTKAIRPNLGKATAAELVKLLAHEDAWYRTTAQRLLLEGRHKDAAAELWKAFEQYAPGKNGTGLAAAQLAWLLRALDASKHPACAEKLLLSPEDGARMQGLLLLRDLPEPWPEFAMPLVIDSLKSTSPAVRFHAVLVGGQHWGNNLKPLADLVALRQANDPWLRLAVAAAVPEHAGELLALLANKDVVTGPDEALLEELARVVGARRDAKETAKVLRAYLGDRQPHIARATQMRVLVNLADSMNRRGTRLLAFLDKLPAEDQDAARWTRAALNVYCEDAAEPPDRPECLLAVRLLAHTRWDLTKDIFGELFPKSPDNVRLAMIRALAVRDEPEIAALLLKDWKGYTPALRREATEALLRQPDRVKSLLAAVEAGKVKPGDLDPLRVKQLLNHKDPELREKARKLLEGSQPAERKEVLQKYQAALQQKGDPKKGKLVFQKNCATCHKVAGIGVDVGPDISDTRTKTPEALLVDILLPNAAIDNNYMSYIVTLKNGRTVTGMIVTETATSLTLKRAEAQTETVLRADVEEIASTGQSLMPEGLEKGITIAEMADLLAFLKNWRYEK